MTGGLVHFLRGLLRMPMYARAWVVGLAGLNGVAPLFFWTHLEARVVLGVFLAGFVLMIVITHFAGFSRLLGAGHFLWFPLLLWLVLRLVEAPSSDAFGLWLSVLMAVNAVSLAIDTVDVIRWAGGDRQEMVEIP